MGRDPGQAQSERAKRGLRHTDHLVSQVVLNHPGRDHAIGWARSDGSAPAKQDRGGQGTNPANRRGWSSYAFAQALTNQPWSLSQQLRCLCRERGGKKKNDMECQRTFSGARISDVITAVCAARRVSARDLKARTRAQPLCRYRQEAMALARELTGRSYPAIAQHFGDLDHTTVIHATQQTRRREKSDVAYASELAAMRAHIRELIGARDRMVGGASSSWKPAAPQMQMLRPTSVRISMELLP